MASFAGKIWLVDEPSAQLSGLIDVDAWWIRIVVDGQEVANWARDRVRFSEAATCFELLTDVKQSASRRPRRLYSGTKSSRVP